MTQLNSSWRVFGRTKVLDKGYVLKFLVDFDPDLIESRITKLPDFLRSVAIARFPRYRRMGGRIEIFIYKFGPKIANPKNYLIRRNLAPGNIVDLLLIISQSDLLKRRLVIACEDRFANSAFDGPAIRLPALDFRRGKIEFVFVVPSAGRDRMSCYLATRMDFQSLQKSSDS